MSRPVSNRTTKAISLRIEEALEERLRALADEERRPISNMAEIIFEIGLDVYEGREPKVPTTRVKTKGTK